jgi:rod shape-determining protein MreC
MFEKRSTKTYPYLGAALLVIITLHYAGVLLPLENFLRSLLIAPFTRVHSLSVKTGNDYQFFKDKASFMTAYAACTEAAGESNVLRAQLKLLQADNAELRKQLGFKQRSSDTTVAAEVIANNLDGSEQTLVINGGSNNGIAPDQPVMVGNGILVGKILKADADISIVRLINDSRSKIGAVVLNDDSSPGVVDGGYGISLRMQFIPRNENVHIGDQIVTSGLEDKIPKGLLLGTVAVVENEAYQPFQEAVLTPAVNLSKLTFVTVITSSTK